MNRILDSALPAYEHGVCGLPAIVWVPANQVFAPSQELDPAYMKYLADLSSNELLDLIRSEVSSCPDAVYDHDSKMYYLATSRSSFAVIIAFLYGSDKWCPFIKKENEGIQLQLNVTPIRYASVASRLNVLNQTEVNILTEDGYKSYSVKDVREIPNLVIEDFDYGFFRSVRKEEQENWEASRIKKIHDCLQMSEEGEPINDEFNPDKIKLKSLTISKVGELEGLIQNYLSATGEGSKTVPCLCGLSGIAKSAILKALGKKNDWRYVDFRAAFLHQLDLVGMTSVVNSEGKLVSKGDTSDALFTTYSPLGDFVKCSDQYIDYAVAMTAALSAEIDRRAASELATEQSALFNGVADSELEILRDKFISESRTPLLVFEEIIRAKVKILNIFTVLLDTRKMGELTFFKAKIAATANTPEGLSLDKEEAIGLFVGQEVTDPAVLNRLAVIAVTPQVATPSWIDWAQREGIDSVVVDFIKKYPNAAYDVVMLNDASVDIEVKRRTAYPTFRGWENIDKAVKNSRKGGSIFKEQIKGILGDNMYSKSFISFAEAHSNVVSFSTVTSSGASILTDPMTAIAEANMEAGIPTLLAAFSSAGKSARISSISRSKGYEVMTFQMSQQSQTDLMGAPSTLGMSDYAVSDSNHLDLSADARGALAVLSDNITSQMPGFPNRVTVRAPNAEISSRIKAIQERRALGENIKLVINYDEINRVPPGQDSVMSAVFEAISDNRFAGVEFNSDEVIVVATANISQEGLDDFKPDEIDKKLIEAYGEKADYTGTRELDSALKLRFCSYEKPRVDIADAKEFKIYVDKCTDWHPIIKSFIKNSDDEVVMYFLKSSEYKSMLHNVPATRNFETLSTQIKENQYYWTGAFAVTDSGVRTQMILDLNAGKPDTNACRAVLTRLSGLQDWVGRTLIPFPEAFEGVDDAVELRKLVDYVVKTPNTTDVLVKQLTLVILNIEDAISGKRSKLISSYIGEDSKNLASTATLNDSLMVHYESDSGSAGDLVVTDQASAYKFMDRARKTILTPDGLVDKYLVPLVQDQLARNTPVNLVYIFTYILSNYESTIAYILIYRMIQENPDLYTYDALFNKFNKQIANCTYQGKFNDINVEFSKLAKRYRK